MSPNFRIATRFLLARKRSMLMSLTGIVFGVGFFIVTQAQTSGFEEFFIKTILGTDGAIRIEDKFQDAQPLIAVGGDHGFITRLRESGRPYISGVENPKNLRQALRQFLNVSAVSEVLRGRAEIASVLSSESVQVYGIKLDEHLAVSALESQIILGDLREYRSNPTGLLVGKKLADMLQLRIGDSVILRANDQARRYRIDAIYQTGVTDIDRVRVYTHMGEARSLLRQPFGATFLQVTLFDRDRAPQDAARMQEVLQHRAMSWQEREQVWLEVFRVLRFSSAITVSTIILISGLGMFNTLAMIVMEKTREISILRSMGYTRRDIARIFIWQGALVLAIGTALGWLAGAAITLGISSVPIRIRGIFSADHFQVEWSPWHYVAAALTAGVIVMIACLIPARRAARLEPGDVIRGTAS